MSSPLSQGRIVWATVPDPRGGNEKTRPAAILTTTADIDPAGEVQVAAITTDSGNTRSSETVELAASPSGHQDARLDKPCEVVCSWVVSVPVAKVKDSGGFVPPDVLAEILAKIQRLT